MSQESSVNNTNADAGSSASRADNTDAVAGYSTSHSDNNNMIDSGDEENTDAAPLDLTQGTKLVSYKDSQSNSPLDLSVTRMPIDILVKPTSTCCVESVDTITEEEQLVVDNIGKPSLNDLDQQGVCVFKSLWKTA